MITHSIILLIIVTAYLWGSIPGAIILCQILHLPDPRNYGSKNPGTTNIFRTQGYKLAIAVMIFDILKGAAPIWLGLYYEMYPIHLNLIAIAICIGHMYPIFFQFKGGKGVATTFGSITAINTNFLIIMASTWILIVLLFRYASLGSIITAIVLPIYAWYIKYQQIYFIILLSILIITRHTNNIKQLWNNQEKKI